MPLNIVAKLSNLDISWSPTLRKKCPYSELFWSVISRLWTEYREIQSISPYSIRMWENTDQNKFEYGHFLRSAIVRLIYWKSFWKSI